MCNYIFLKNTQDNRNIIQEIKNISIENDHFYINDNPSHEQNHEEFKDHRHDQSVFSLMSKKYKFYCIPDETYWAPNWNVLEKIIRYGLTEINFENLK